MKKRNSSSDSLDKRDDDEMEEDMENEGGKDFNPDVLDDALDGDEIDGDESLDELEEKEYEDMEDGEDNIFSNNDEDSPFWKL